MPSHRCTALPGGKPDSLSHHHVHRLPVGLSSETRLTIRRRWPALPIRSRHQLASATRIATRILPPTENRNARGSPRSSLSCTLVRPTPPVQLRADSIVAREPNLNDPLVSGNAWSDCSLTTVHSRELPERVPQLWLQVVAVDVAWLGGVRQLARRPVDRFGCARRPNRAPPCAVLARALPPCRSNAARRGARS
jgi:hypothetical protein